MKRFIGFLILIGLLLSLAAPLTAQEATPAAVGLRPDAPTYAQHGPYWVGTREFVIEPDSERPLPTTVWYPALNPQGLPEATTYSYQNFATIAGFMEQAMLSQTLRLISVVVPTRWSLSRMVRSVIAMISPTWPNISHPMALSQWRLIILAIRLPMRPTRSWPARIMMSG